VAARDRLARRATRSRTAVPWLGRPRRDLRRGKAEASAGPATGGRRITMQGDDVHSDDGWRWRSVAVSSEKPRTASSLDPSGSGEALMARQVGRRNCGAKAAVRRDELEGASMQPNTAVLQGATRVCWPCFSGTHACAKEGLAREQLDPGGSRRSCPSEPMRLHRLVPGVHNVQQFLPSWIAQPLSPRVSTKTTPLAIFHPRQPFPANLFVIHGTSSPSSTSHRRSFSSREFTFCLFFSTTKVCPDSLNLSNASDPFARILSVSSCYPFFPDQGLDCFDLESSRVFSINFPELSLFQTNELLHFIDFRRKFIKM
jgi:hypothetical protein